MVLTWICLLQINLQFSDSEGNWTLYLDEKKNSGQLEIGDDLIYLINIAVSQDVFQV